MNLVVVESPTKARTLARFLGGDFRLAASYGHIRDLPQKRLGVKIELDKFIPEYVQTAKQKQTTKLLKQASAQAGQIYLATDPDREGEAIAWHVTTLLKSQIPNLKSHRIVFHEITPTAVAQALAHPRGIDSQLVDAQQARRILDRLVGYKLSPLLWRKVRKGLSAGRVQSVALRLIVEREREIEAFQPQEYWEIWVELQAAKLRQLKVKLISEEVKDQQRAEEVEADLRSAQYWVHSVEKKDFARTPPPPFTTSTLQQAAANRLGWSAKKTMQVAQNLYEEGLISYHRTDSTNLAQAAVVAAKAFIAQRWGGEFALDRPRVYKTKSKVAQEAHEAIRPTEVGRLAASVGLNRDEVRLYDLVWKRFVGCQMAEARGVAVKVIVNSNSKEGNEYKLEARGETITFTGWYKLDPDRDRELRLPQVEEGEKLEFVDLTKEQKFTQPPARYTDASLIKTLEELGIGRPSTYAPTVTTIQERQYVERQDLPAGRQGKRFRPTALGLAVNDFLVANFADIVDYGFTAKMEDELDDIARGERLWQPTIKEFYEPFATKLGMVTETAARVKVEVETTGEKCPKCGQGDVVIRLGKFGRFLSCSRYPECDYKANYMEKVGVACPKCGGEVVVRRSRRGKNFYGCSNYPKCDFASWTKPR